MFSFIDYRLYTHIILFTRNTINVGCSTDERKGGDKNPFLHQFRQLLSLLSLRMVVLIFFVCVCLCEFVRTWYAKFIYFIRSVWSSRLWKKLFEHNDMTTVGTCNVTARYTFPAWPTYCVTNVPVSKATVIVLTLLYAERFKSSSRTP